MVRKLGIGFYYFVTFLSFVNTLPLTVHTLTKPNNDLESVLVSEKNKVNITRINNQMDNVSVNEKKLGNINDGLRNVRQNTLRPGMTIREYYINLSFEDNVFYGRLEFRAFITTETRGNPLIFHTNDLLINSVLVSLTTEENANPANFELNNNRLIIRPQGAALSYLVIIEYSGTLTNDARGLYYGVNNA
ncbi:unnamed protein product [Diatraea saccharalis]|uniref:Uncharacterized protein n=1 Tax=Diatraea saccharalis TaxID=40085 RepID=A0A9N9RF06_9NEOP|nr:unnamed protein product [Diatraea saccharalis]